MSDTVLVAVQDSTPDVATLTQKVKDALGAYGEATYAYEVWQTRRDVARKAIEDAQAELARAQAPK